MNSSKNRSRTLRLTQMALLTAIILLMAFTPLGYLKIGQLSITFLTIPVVIGATVLGPRDGAFLGAVFGATSFAQCFGLDVFGTTLFGINPVFTALMCFIPRILIGVVSGYLMKAFRNTKIPAIAAYLLCSLAGALTNTILFVGMLMLLFGNSEYIQAFGSSAIQIIWLLTGINAVVEAIVCTFVGGIVSERIHAAVSRMN